MTSMILGIGLFSYAMSQEETDPVLDFYVTQAAKALENSQAKAEILRFTFVAYTHYKQLGRGGRVVRLDTVVSRYFMTGGIIDSTKIIAEATSTIPAPTFSFQDIFSEFFIHNFYPNDIGEEDLAIGFDTPTSEDTLPTGVAVIDREKYYLKRLHLYFQNRVGFKRLTRSFLFSVQDGFIFPDSIWELGAKKGVLSTDYYRLETDIEQVQLLR